MEKPESTTINKVQVAIILINYNGSEDTVKCVENILSKTSKALAYEIIIIDNASNRDDFDALQNLLMGLKRPQGKALSEQDQYGFRGREHDGGTICQCRSLSFSQQRYPPDQRRGFDLPRFHGKTADAAVCGAQIYDQNEKPG